MTLAAGISRMQQVRHLILQRMIGIGTVDLAGCRLRTRFAAQGGLSRLAEHALQIGQQHRRLHTLPDRLHGPPAEVPQFPPALEHQVKGLVSPAPMIHLQKIPPWDTGLRPATKWPAPPIPRSADAHSQSGLSISRAAPAAGTPPSDRAAHRARRPGFDGPGRAETTPAPPEKNPSNSG